MVFDFEKTITISFSVFGTRNSKILMEVNADKPEPAKFPHCRQDYACESNGAMEELNANLEEATNYLIQWFYKTGQRYSCTRTKVGKLLSIVALVYARQNKRVFKENVYKYTDCGMAIYEIMERFMATDIYRQYSYEDTNEAIVNSPIIDCEIPSEYQNTSSVSDETRGIIDQVFQLFGAYLPSYLGECLNPIAEAPGVTTLENIIDLAKIQKLDKSLFDSVDEKYRRVIDFLRNY